MFFWCSLFKVGIHKRNPGLTEVNADLPQQNCLCEFKVCLCCMFWFLINSVFSQPITQSQDTFLQVWILMAENSEWSGYFSTLKDLSHDFFSRRQIFIHGTSGCQHRAQQTVTPRGPLQPRLGAAFSSLASEDVPGCCKATHTFLLE